MIFYSSFNSPSLQDAPEKSKIVQIILENCYKDQIQNNDVVIATNNVGLRTKFGPLHLNLVDIKNVHTNSKIILYLIDVEYKEYISYHYDALKCADEVWSSEPDIVNMCLLRDIPAYYKPLVHTPALQLVENKIDPKLDILLYNSVDFFTSPLLKLLIDKNLKVFNTNNFDILNKNLGDAKIVLHLPHYFVSGYCDPNGYVKNEENFLQEQTKLRYLLSNNKCVITKKSMNNHFSNLVSITFNEILEVIFYLLENNRWKNFTKSFI